MNCINGDGNSLLAVFSFTEQGSRQNVIISELLQEHGYQCESYTVSKFSDEYPLQSLPAELKDWIGERWGRYTFLFIGAAGIAIRYIAPWVADKYTDSAVLSMDEKGDYVIPLLSGHVGGAVELAQIIASVHGAVPVISTATDVQCKFAVDVFAKKNHLHIENRVLAKEVSASILQGKKVGFYSDVSVSGSLPSEISFCDSMEELGEYETSFAIVEKKDCVNKGYSGEPENKILYLTPKNLVVGIGCRRGVPVEVLKEKLQKLLGTLGLSESEISTFASIDLKRDEAGILELAKDYRVPFFVYSAEELQDVETVSPPSEFVQSITGVDNVCERAARKYAPEGMLLQTKVKIDGVTFALVRTDTNVTF